MAKLCEGKKEESMKKIILLAVAVCFGCGIAYAQDSGAASTAADRRAQMKADRQAVMTMKQERKEQAKAAKSEEKALRDQMAAAQRSGDKEKAAQIREQLKTMHHENVLERKQDKKELKSKRMEMKQERKELRTEKKQIKQDARAARKAARIPPPPAAE